MSEAYLWKVGIGEIGNSEPVEEWIYVLAPDIATAQRIVEEYLDGGFWKDDTPLICVVAVHIVKMFVLAGTDMVSRSNQLEWAKE